MIVAVIITKKNLQLDKDNIEENYVIYMIVKTF